MPEKLDIIIVGAGLGGLAAAVALCQDNHRVTVLEASQAMGEIGAGIQVTPNFTRILHRWGLGEALAKAGVLPEWVTQRRWENGKCLTRFALNANDRMEQEFGYQYYLIHRKDLHRILLEKAVELGAVVKTAISVQQRVILRDGASLAAHLIIAADGIKSVLNRFVTGADLKPQPTGDAAYRALLTREQMQDPELASLRLEQGPTVWLGPKSHVVGYYVDGGRLYNMVILVPQEEADEENWKLQGDVNKLRIFFKGWDTRLQKMIGMIGSSYIWNLYDREALDRWLHPLGNLVLLGDAAHPMLPYVAQGAASAIEDAASLAECLKSVPAVHSLRISLTVYESLRKPRAYSMRDAGRKNQVYFHLPDGPEQEKRDSELESGDESKKTPNQLNDEKILDMMYAYDVIEETRKALSF
ncbi:monooxygenase [Talaromyces proteolyticus]|uniref:Monooxygenase n=1 Tax=Talaromyces proteolyticus TaxID=1131652 RepID=A0AAD4KIQ9_9EURO|nr:monooxygenase [Talaromyces proteolyticus]KAH8691278.1 monooxygenase [Talaromyces proteolyticus]